MKINASVRIKNPWFWVGLIGTIFAAMGVNAEMFTSWASVWHAVVGLFTNPFQLGCVLVAILGVFVDPTTNGFGDSAQALTYTTPKKDEK